MRKTLSDRDFLNSIVWVNSFRIAMNLASIEILTIEDGKTEVKYVVSINEICYFEFKQFEIDPDGGFSVIDAFLEKFNDCVYVDTMHSQEMNDYWMFRMHSGTHHLLIGFKTNSLSLV